MGSNGQLLFRGALGQAQISTSQNMPTLITLPTNEHANLFRWSPDDHSISYMVDPMQEDDPNAGLWVLDLNKPARQVFRGWVTWYARGPKTRSTLYKAKQT